MLDLKFVRENPDIVKQNIKNKFQDSKLPLVDEVIALDAENRTTQKEADDLRASRNKLSKQIGALMGQGKKEEAEEVKKQVSANSARLTELEAKEAELSEKILKIMMTIPNIIDPSVPIGKDDSQNVEIERFGEPVVPDFEIPSSLRKFKLLSWTVWVRHLLCQPDNCSGKRFVSGSCGPSGGATYRGIGGIKSFIGVFHNLVENSSIFPLGVGNG